VLAAKAALAAAMSSGNRDAIAEAERALEAAEAKAKETTAGKAAGGAYSRRATARAASHILGRPGPGEPSGFLVVPGRAEGVRGPAAWSRRSATNNLSLSHPSPFSSCSFSYSRRVE